MKVGVLGSGIVAQTLATGFIKHGHEVKIGTSNVSKLNDWAENNTKGSVGSFADTAKFGDIVVLTVKGSAAADVLRAAGAENFSDKIVIDTTNPIADAPPTNGVLTYFTNANESLMERLQNEFKGAQFVKAFNSVGNNVMVNPQYTETKPTMFICGNDEDAKNTVTEILDQFGWETVNMGKVESARPIESLCILWCIPGFMRNEWSHAFKLVK